MRIIVLLFSQKPSSDCFRDLLEYLGIIWELFRFQQARSDH